MYDGTTAAATAMMMAVAAGKKQNKEVVSGAMNPNTIEVLKTYALHQGIELFILPVEDGVTKLSALNSQLSTGGVAGVLVQQPNVYGIVEDFTGFAEACHE